MQSVFARDTKNNMHTQQYISVRDLIENPLFLFLGVRLGFLGVLLGFCIFFFFYILPPCSKFSLHFIFIVVQKRVALGRRDGHKTRRQISRRKRRALEAILTDPTPPDSVRVLFFFFLLNRNISRWREREREGRNTHAAGVVWDLSRWRKKTPLLDGRVCERVLSNSLPSL